jgi:phospholipid/cholesterol/gamma-HCH transport system substrate-binding protein
VGLAGESRSGDANGQWFRVLASGGTNLVPLAPGVFGTTATPILGANPPKPKGRPPLNATVPCETQEHPDLRSQPGDPPEQKRIDTSSQAFQDRLALARGRAIKWLEKQIKVEDLAGELKVGDKDATKQLIDRIASLKQRKP